MATVLEQRREELKAKQQALSAIFTEAGSELDLSKVKSLDGDTAAKAAEIKRLNSELTALGEEIDALSIVEKASVDFNASRKSAEHVENKGAEPARVKSLGELFVESATYKQRMGSRGPLSEVQGAELKTLMQTSAGWAPESIRQPGYVPSAQMEPNVIDIVPFGRTNQAAVVYMLESTFTNNAAERAEGANNAGEAALALTATTNTVREIAVWLPVTREQMDDVPYIQSYVNQRLSLMLRQRLETQIMAGNGVAPNLAGLIGLASCQTQAKGADVVMDAIHKAITLCNVTGRANADAIVMHPNDWQDVRLTRTADGIYILGNPGQGGAARLWGLPVVQSTACTENTAVVADFRNFTQLVEKQGVQFEYTDSHASYFIQRTLAILATIRVAFVVYRPEAVVNVTGI